MGFWEGWLWSELTQPNKQTYVPDVQLTADDYHNLAIARYEAEQAFQEGVRIGYSDDTAYQEGYNTPIDYKSIESLGFKDRKEDLIKAIDEGKVQVYLEGGYSKVRWAKK